MAETGLNVATKGGGGKSILLPIGKGNQVDIQGVRGGDHWGWSILWFHQSRFSSNRDTHCITSTVRGKNLQASSYRRWVWILVQFAPQVAGHGGAVAKNQHGSILLSLRIKKIQATPLPLLDQTGRSPTPPSHPCSSRPDPINEQAFRATKTAGTNCGWPNFSADRAGRNIGTWLSCFVLFFFVFYQTIAVTLYQ